MRDSISLVKTIGCPFCQLEKTDYVFESPLVIGIRDRYPVSPGHALIIPRRHVSSFFETTPEEQAALWQAVEKVRLDLDRSSPLRFQFPRAMSGSTAFDACKRHSELSKGGKDHEFYE